MNKKEFLLEQKDCAKMLGLSLKEYQKSLKKVVAPKNDDSIVCKTKKSFFEYFNIDKRMLKTK